MLSDAEIIKIAADTKTAEPGLNGYILPISFAREVERAVLAKAQVPDAIALLQRVAGSSTESIGNESSKMLFNGSQWHAGYVIDETVEATPAPKQEPVGYVVIGQGISFYKTTLEEANHQANSLEWRDDKEPVIYPVFKSYPITLNQKEVWFRRVETPGYPVDHLVMSYKGAGDVGPFYSAPVPAPPQAAAIPDEINDPCADEYTRTWNKGWNACREAMLAAAPKPEGE